MLIRPVTVFNGKLTSVATVSVVVTMPAVGLSLLTQRSTDDLVLPDRITSDCTFSGRQT